MSSPRWKKTSNAIKKGPALPGRPASPGKFIYPNISRYISSLNPTMRVFPTFIAGARRVPVRPRRAFFKSSSAGFSFRRSKCTDFSPFPAYMSSTSLRRAGSRQTCTSFLMNFPDCPVLMKFPQGTPATVCRTFTPNGGKTS